MTQPVAEGEISAPYNLRWINELSVQSKGERELEAGRSISLKFGHGKTSILILLSGLCWSEWRPGSSRRRILDLFCPGDVICPASLPRFGGADITVAERSRIVKVSLSDLELATQRDQHVLKLVMEQLRKNEQRKLILVSSLGGLTAEARVAALFVELSLRLKIKSGDQSGFQIPLSRQDIADHLALNADTLSRIISRLKTDGVFQQIGRDKIYIKDWPALLNHCPISDALLQEYCAE